MGKGGYDDAVTSGALSLALARINTLTEQLDRLQADLYFAQMKIQALERRLNGEQVPVNFTIAAEPFVRAMRSATDRFAGPMGITLKTEDTTPPADLSGARRVIVE